MCTLNKFLCCFELEVGGIVIGGFNLISSLVVIVSQVVNIATFTSSQAASNEYYKLIVEIIVLLFSFVIMIASLFLIKGIEKVSLLAYFAEKLSF